MEMTILEKAKQFAEYHHNGTNHQYDGHPYTYHLDMVFKVAEKFIHLVPHDKVIPPYNVTLKELSSDKRKEWSDEVLKQIQAKGYSLDKDKFIFLAGNAYRQYLVPEMKHTEVPFEGLRIGQQKSALLKKLKESFDKQQIVDIATEFIESDKFKPKDDCKHSVRNFVNWVKDNKGFEPDVMLLAPPLDIERFPGQGGKGDSHIFSIINGYAIDFTAKQFDSNQPLIKIIFGNTVKITEIYVE